MQLWVSFLIPVAAAAIAVLAAAGERARLVQHQRAELSAWQAVATELGLTLAGNHVRWALHGQLQGVPVRVDVQRLPKHAGFAVTFSAGGGGRLPAKLRVRKESLAHSLGRLLEGEEQDRPTGDASFDDLVDLPGMDAQVCAALSRNARQHLAALVERGGGVNDGVLRLDRVMEHRTNRAEVGQTLEFLVGLCSLLNVDASTLHARLAQNAVQDPQRGVRLQNLRYLIDPGLQTPTALIATTARALLGDADPELRLQAALQLDAQGSPVLAALARAADVSTPLRVQALQALGKRNIPELEALLESLLGSSPPELVCAALELLATRPHGALARRAEPVLVQLLSHASEEVQRASAEALGSVGSVAAVEPLLPLADGFGRAQLRQAARSAIGRIQARLGNVDAGRVSLADDRELAGAVDVADTAVRVGELSVADDLEAAPEASRAEARSLRS